MIEWQTKHIARLIAASVPHEGDGAHPLIEYAESISLDTEDEKKALEDAIDPMDKLQIGGFERISQFLSMSR